MNVKCPSTAIFLAPVMVSTITNIIDVNNNITTTATTNTTASANSVSGLDSATQWLWRVVTPIIIVVGLLGNGVVVVVFCRLHFRQSSTLVHMFILAVTDSVILCLGPMR